MDSSSSSSSITVEMLKVLRSQLQSIELIIEMIESKLSIEPEIECECECECEMCDPDMYGWFLNFVKDNVPGIKPEKGESITEIIKRYAPIYKQDEKKFHDELRSKFKIYQQECIKKSLGGDSIFN